jgi:hypothetical protein
MSKEKRKEPLLDPYEAYKRLLEMQPKKQEQKQPQPPK